MSDRRAGTASRARGRYGPALTVVALIGLAISSYLLAARLLGEAPACGPVKGCETVAASEYATVVGIPVALVGVVFSVMLVVASAAWWRLADRRALYAAYGLGLAGIIAITYLTYLEVVVIKAICAWCVAYAVTVVTCWLGVVVAAWSTGRDRPRLAKGPGDRPVPSAGSGSPPTPAD